ncbi:carbohydrate-binding family 9-like protein [Flammeovirga agarivorans]|uniref:Carbohydrate-binding family 9-like protein n=1 Tax=Flammeovirga agarivorans TaxID=2726742 RepID=A0A7X8SPU3_9BACT|nr:carbohydrate-binding family 9-like protein [Flammeovirga agarivorans]NLR94161.1 carbohydrate-binding family 9-like protein [Flammeovirga agarivorans]
MRTPFLIIQLVILPLFTFAQVYPTPESYLCYSTSEPIEVDGVLDEEDWEKAEWSKLFVDIEGDKQPAPLFETKMKMLWDKDYLYIAAELIEPHLWSTIEERDAVIYQDNDFEVFINPNPNSHQYYEFEMNLLNTVWDLMMTKPYRDGGSYMNAWHIEGLKSAVKLYGTINDPSDIDDKWTLEIAFPWAVLAQEKPVLIYPEEGRRWRINFSRVEWQHEIVDGKYTKKIDPNTGNSFPEYNWVWSPQGEIAMHMPEQWGYIQFTENKVGDKKDIDVSETESERLYRQLFDIYRAQKTYWLKYREYAYSLDQLGWKTPFLYKGTEVIPLITKIPGGYIVSLEIPQEKKTLMVRYDSYGEVITHP